ncbi:MAG: hypothetical protein ACQEUZ_01520 [Pseudomonadota bacterium]
MAHLAWNLTGFGMVSDKPLDAKGGGVAKVTPATSRQWAGAWREDRLVPGRPRPGAEPRDVTTGADGGPARGRWNAGDRPALGCCELARAVAANCALLEEA